MKYQNVQLYHNYKKESMTSIIALKKRYIGTYNINKKINRYL